MEEKNYNAITYFKNYSPTFFSFLNFYTEIWNCKQFFFS